MSRRKRSSRIEIPGFRPLEKMYGSLALHTAYILLQDRMLTAEQCKPIMKQLQQERTQ